MKTQKIINLTIFIFTLILCYMPIFLILIYSFNDGYSVDFEGFSFRWYRELFQNSDRLWKAFTMSVFIGIMSASMSTILGSFGAWGIIQCKNKNFKKFLLSLCYMPLMLPDLIIGISLVTLFMIISLPLGISSVFIAHTTMNIPFSLLLVLTILEESDMSIIEASKDLGASEIQTWLYVIFPIIRPALIASFLLTLTLSLDDFAITFFVSGPGATTLPIHVYSAIRFGLTPAINALSVLIIGISIILFCLNKNYLKVLWK